jgi:methylmalonyl-CoA mutase cobalamin-binding domain/chain
MLEKTIAAYNEAIFDTDRDRALEVVNNALTRGVSPEDVVFKIVIPAIEEMMETISHSVDANLAQHFLTAQIASEVTEKMLPLFKQAPEIEGRVVIGTAHGDLHSLGKRIVSGCLKSMMIEVIDIGVNVPAERFVEEAVAHAAQVVGISAMMMHTARGENGCLKVRELLQQRGLEKDIKIIVGGAPYRFDPDLYKLVQADAWAADGISAARVIKQLIQETRT